jgi:A/G-specific adenine glycosylase
LDQDNFSSRLLQWFDTHGRHDLPWQHNPTSYRVWVSEIMLQQTQVVTVIPYYARFMACFDSINTLAESSLDELMQHWAGLGYYARGRNLHKAAQIIVEQYQGHFPEDIDSVNALPGIGRSTAGAILALSKNQRHAILDGNVKRCLCRFHGVEGYPGLKKVEQKLWKLAEENTPSRRVADYTQAIMDMGATLCTRSKPDCAACPQRHQCYALKHNTISSLPFPKPRKVRPGKHRYMLALVDDAQRVALFRRPLTGIWGGLYSLPEFETQKACKEQLARYQINVSNKLHAADDIHHAFSHFDLRITPLVLSLSAHSLDNLLKADTTVTISDSIGVQMTEHSLHDLSSKASEPAVGVPTPIRKILNTLSGTPT